MNIRINGRWVVVCAATLISLATAPSTHAEAPLLRGTGARVSFDLITYREMKKSDHRHSGTHSKRYARNCFLRATLHRRASHVRLSAVSGLKKAAYCE
jgi:hypothetical protein